MAMIYNWGILGAGGVAGKFVNDLKLLPNANPYAVGSKSAERAATFAASHGIKKSYGSYEALASDPAVDIVYIATRHNGHYPASLLCLSNGKPVLCEKPVAVNRLQFERMAGLAKEKRLFFMEALWTRFIPSFLRCREIVAGGNIGEVRLIESDFCLNAPVYPDGRLYNPRFGGGSLLDIGLYPVFLALEIGSEIVDVKALAALDRGGIDTSCSMLMAHAGGELSILFSSITTSGRIESVIHGSRGMVRLNRMWHTPTSIDLMPDHAPPEHITFDEPGGGYQYEAAEVMKCLDAGRKESALWPWEKSRQLITLLDRVREIAGIAYPAEVEAV
ncbi:MAG: Gfo/Idh/MocA family oxidoreductase [Chitinispirillaceae bacterium]|nr:Gfo/Idh/MocA family oxidoreductase [Chitinispirillaceae bacterium]